MATTAGGLVKHCLRHGRLVPFEAQSGKEVQGVWLDFVVGEAIPRLVNLLGSDCRPAVRHVVRWNFVLGGFAPGKGFVVFAVDVQVRC